MWCYSSPFYYDCTFNENYVVMEDQVTRLTLESNDELLTVEVPGTNLSYFQFMELIEIMIKSNTCYSKHEVESYILDWAESIRATKEN